MKEVEKLLEEKKLLNLIRAVHSLLHLYDALENNTTEQVKLKDELQLKLIKKERRSTK